ncbi:MAG: lysophospholipid acyltransferase family protein [Gemmataceae bacterium]
MKLRHPFWIKTAALTLSGILQAWFGTLRYRWQEAVPGTTPHSLRGPERFIFTFWHETLLIPAMAYQRQNIHMLISQHADGELIAQICRHLGIRVTRGSTTRGGAAALRQMIELSRRSHIAITPDGPRGPRRIAQLGAVKLASETGRAIVPCGFAFHRCWRAPSWDRFAVPYPGTPCVGVSAEPLAVPPGLDRGELELYRIRLEDAMLQVTAYAESWAARERW